MLIVTINNIHAKHLRFDVSIIYTEIVHCNNSLYIHSTAYTSAHVHIGTHRLFYHTSYTSSPIK